MSASSAPLILGGAEAGQGSFDEARVVVLPVPLELTVSYGSGTGQGPAAILQASSQFELYDEEAGRPYWSPGSVHTLPPVRLPRDPEQAMAAIEAAATPAVEAGKFLLALGGEHAVTIGAARPVIRRHPDVGMLIVDAHLDLRAEYQGSPFSHACAARRVIDEHGIQVAWCGIRSVSQEEADYLAAHDLHPCYAHEMDAQRTWIERVLAKLPQRVYLSIDVDGLDPAVMPGTGTPEPGGLLYRDLLALIRAVARHRTIVAADCVEVAPIHGQQVSEFTAARVVAKLIGAIGTP